MENIRQVDIFIPEWLVKGEQETISKKLKKLNKPKTLEQIARVNSKLDDDNLEKGLARKMTNPNYFTDQNLKIGFKINLETHKINHANCMLTITTIYPDFGIETRYKKNSKEMVNIYATKLNQYKVKYHIIFSASFYKTDEEDQRRDETELFNSLNISHNLRETDINNIDVKSHLEHQNQIQITKENSWMFDKYSSKKKKIL